MIKIVLDTNCLIATLSKKGHYFNVWKGLHTGKYRLCISTEILEEYEEIIGMKTNALIASNVIQTLVNSPYVDLIDPYYHFHLIHMDKDDNKFVDCAIAAGVEYLVSNDTHFNVLKTVPFPKVTVLDLVSFSNLIQEYTLYDTNLPDEQMLNEEKVIYASRIHK